MEETTKDISNMLMALRFFKKKRQRREEGACGIVTLKQTPGDDVGVSHLHILGRESKVMETG